MGILDKLMFWKKEDDFDFDKLANQEMGKNGPGLPDDLGLNQPQGLGLEDKPFPDDPNLSSTAGYPAAGRPEQSRQQLSSPNLAATPEISARDLELINSKLDTIKAILNSMDRRIAGIESATAPEQRKQEKLW